MFTQRNLAVRLIMAISVLLVLTSTALAEQPMQGGTNPAPNAAGGTVTVLDQPTHKDRNWPITRVDSWEITDPFTGERYVNKVVIRELPASADPDAQNESCPISGAAATCTYVGQVSATVEDAHLGNIVAKVVHYGKKYSEGSTYLYQPTSLEVWWTRSGNSYSVGNANVHWGCSLCGTQCGGSPKFNAYGPFTPGWLSATQSYTYRYTDTFSKMENLPSIPAWVTGKSDSIGYYNGYQIGTLSAEARLN